MTVRKFLGIIAFSILVLILLAVNQSHAANHYIRAGATGTGTGADWTNAWVDIPRYSTNYGIFVRGDNYYYADGNYSGWWTRSQQIDSTAGTTAFVNIKKATIADHGTETGWINIYGDEQAIFTTSIILFNPCFLLDGQVGTGSDSTSVYGFKIDKTVLEAGSSLSIQADSVFVEHFEITTGGEDTEVAARCIAIAGIASNYVTNAQVRNCYSHDSSSQMWSISYTDSSTIENNYFQRLHNITIHGAGIQFTNTNDLIIRYNIFKDIDGTAPLDWVSGTEDSVYIYNNVFFSTSSQYASSNGVITSTSSSPSATNIFVYNNTIYNITGENLGVGFYAGSGNIVKNNLWYNCEQVGIVNATYDYNAYLSSPLRGTMTAETNDIVGTSDPFVNSAGYDFHLTGNAETINKGVTPLIATDIEGNAYDTNDIGAYRYKGTPTAPTSLASTVNRASHGTLTWTKAATGDSTQIYQNGTWIASVPIAIETYSPQNRVAGTSYNYYIVTKNGTDLSGASNAVRVTTPYYAIRRIR